MALKNSTGILRNPAIFHVDEQVLDSFPCHLCAESTKGCNNGRSRSFEGSNFPEVKQIHWLFSSRAEYFMNWMCSHGSTENPSAPETDDSEVNLTL